MGKQITLSEMQSANNLNQLASALQARRELAVYSVNLLLHGLRTNDEHAISVALRSLGVSDGDALVLRTISLNSALHDLVTDFRDSLELNSEGGLPRAADKLQEVIESSLQASDKTLDICDSNARLLKEQRQELSTLELAFTKTLGEMTPEVSKLIESLHARVNTMQQTNHDIVMAQSFQDLSGQSVKKVIDLIKTIEQQLVCLTSECLNEPNISDRITMIRNEAPSTSLPMQTQIDARAEQGFVWPEKTQD